jgi:hypothetical protein
MYTKRQLLWPEDLLCVSAELLTGKSIPVLVGIVRLPIDRWLACLMLCLGVIAGALFSAYLSRVVLRGTALGYTNRLVQLSFSLFLSLSLLLSVAKGIHYERGVILSIVPAFCVVVQSLPQRSMTAFIAFLLSCLLLLIGMTSSPPTASASVAYPQQGPYIVHSLVGFHTVAEESVGVREIVARAVQLFILAFYASFQHAPIHPADSPSRPHDPLAFYTSHHFQVNARYATLVSLMGAWLRVASWYLLCYFQDNAMHVMLENDRSVGGWNRICCIAYMTTLLFSACWTATQLKEQALSPLSLDSDTARLKTVAAILALATLYRERNADLVFLTTNTLTVFALLATALTLQNDFY